jgi:hypothetical protein
MLMNKILRFSFVALMAMMVGNVMADSWEKASSIAVGDVVLLTVDNSSVTSELKGIKSGNTPIGDIVAYTGVPAGVYPLTVEAGSTEGTFAFKGEDGYLCAVKTKNALNVSETKDALSSWTVTFDGSVATLKTNDGADDRYLKYNSSSPRFACYKSGQTDITLWKKLAAGAILPPTFSVAGGIYFEAQTVALSCETEGAKILYTIPAGQDPEYTDDENYTGVFYDGTPLTISRNTTIKAMAVKDGKTSSIATATYTIIPTEGKGTAESPFSIADALTVVNALADGATSQVVYTQGYVVGDITISNGQAQFKIGATAGAAENLITVYKAKGLENENFVEGDAKAGDLVVINAALQRYVKNEVVTPETQYGYIYSINGETSKTTPTLVGDGSENNPFTANDLIIMKKSQRPTEAVWVKGIIRGSYKSKTELDTDKASNIAIATSAEATEFAPVELKSNSVYREKLNVVDNAANKGKEVKLYGKITDYFSTTGVKDLESAVLDGETISGINDLKVNSKFNGAIYNLAGQRVQTMSRGLYIKDGKKFIVK